MLKRVLQFIIITSSAISGCCSFGNDHTLINFDNNQSIVFPKTFASKLHFVGKNWQNNARGKVFKPGNYLELPSAEICNSTSGTIELWMKRTKLTDGRNHIISYFKNASNRWHFRFEKNKLALFLVSQKKTSQIRIKIPDNEQGNKWIHLALCWRKNASGITNVSIYYNGNRIVSKDCTADLSVSDKGKIIVGAYNGGSLSLNGVIKTITFWEKSQFSSKRIPNIASKLNLKLLHSELTAARIQKQKLSNLDKIAYEQILEKTKKTINSMNDMDMLSKAYDIKLEKIRTKLNKLKMLSSKAMWWKDKAVVPFMCYPQSCMVKIRNCWSDAPTKSQPVILNSAGNEWNSFQLVIMPSNVTIKNCHIAISELTSTQNNHIISSDNIKYFKVGNVSEHTASSLKANRKWADPFFKMSNPFELDKNRTYPVWFNLYVPAGTPKGTYRGSIQIKSKNYKVTVPLKLSVYGFSLPKTPKVKTAFGIQGSLIASYYKLPNDSDRLDSMINKYLKNMLLHKISPKPRFIPSISNYGDRYFLSPKLILTKNGKWKIDFLDYKKELKKLMSSGLNSIQVGGRSWDGNFRRIKNKNAAFMLFPYYSEKDKKEKILKLKLFSEKYMKVLYFTFSKWFEFLKAENLDRLAHAYPIDEPKPDMYEMTNRIAGLIHKAAPGLKVLVTSKNFDKLDNIDIWCPTLDRLNIENVNSFKKTGRTLWTYVCIVPPSPNANFFIHQTALQNRIPFWVAYKYGCEGFLYYEHTLSLWKKRNVWKDQRWEKNSGTEGDGFLVYPGKDGPIGTIRLELIRQGIQDVGYFLKLKSLADKLSGKHPAKIEGKKLLEISDSLIKNSSKYSSSVSQYLEKKEQVAKMIEKINTILLTR
jgi:Glycoside hydrolase 123, catalytic domain/Concanavalin A-like lectin/glucanases superfamily/Glycoside hydrolase 123 N-terminal domain